MTATRRLAAILAADVAGYSRLIGEDEGGTLQAFKAIKAELIDPKIAEHHGRIVKNTGDGLLVEFASVVDAVRCAVDVQQAVPERNTGVGADKSIELDRCAERRTSLGRPLRRLARRCVRSARQGGVELRRGHRAGIAGGRDRPLC